MDMFHGLFYAALLLIFIDLFVGDLGMQRIGPDGPLV